MTERPTVSHVYTAIAAITKALSKEGVAKGRKNQAQGYAFRGIDDMYNALSPLLAEHQLCIIPRVLDRVVSERETAKGGVLFSVVVAMEFDLVSALDGSHHTAKMYGEAMDSGDKATNKAMSAAYKYLAMEVFCIPTEGDNDADALTHEVTPRKAKPEPRPANVTEDGEVKGYVLNGEALALATDTRLRQLAVWAAAKPIERASAGTAITEEQERRRSKAADAMPAPVGAP